MIEGYAVQYKLFWIEFTRSSGGIKFFLAGKCTDDFIDVSMVTNKMLLRHWFKALFQSSQFMPCNITDMIARK